MRGNGYIYGVFFEDSLYETTSMSIILNKYLKDRPYKRGIDIGITNILYGILILINNFLIGSFKVFNENTSYADMLKVLHASITYPGISTLVDAF